MPQAVQSTWAYKRRVGLAASRVVPIPIPEVISGSGATEKMAETLKSIGVTKPLIVTDAILLKLGMLQGCLGSLDKAGMSYEIFGDVEPNPTESLCCRAFEAYKAAGCDSVVAFGGGSPMDAAKAVCAQACACMHS